MKTIKEHLQHWQKNFEHYNLMDIDYNTYLIMNKVVKNVFYENGKPIYELYEKEQPYKPKKKRKAKSYFTKMKNAK
jgi:hypothetical protein